MEQSFQDSMERGRLDRAEIISCFLFPNTPKNKEEHGDQENQWYFLRVQNTQLACKADRGDNLSEERK